MTGERCGAALRGGVAVALALLAGCSLWPEETEEPSKLPAARMSPDTVVLDIFTLDPAGELGPLTEEIWRQLDEQHLPPETRVWLSANGMRCGRCGVQLPPAVFQLLEQSTQATREANSFAHGAPGAIVRRRLQSRAGKRGRIVMSGPHERLDVIWNESGEERGEAYEQATCLIAVRTFPMGDGRVRVELTPEIEHGPLRQRLTDGEGALRWEASQDRRVYDALCMVSLLAPGQTVVLSASPSMSGLGRPFFVRESDGPPRPVYLVVRLAQTQHDDRFGAEQTATPLVTPNE
jgi:hypothetical protein